MMQKPADNQYPLHELIQNRWSPRAFSERLVEPEKILSLLEAARWAASSMNEQPWRFIVTTKEDSAEFERMLDCLFEGNQSWAKRAPVLMIVVAKMQFSRNDRDNRSAYHDVGLAMGNLMLQATAMDLYIHMMGGFDRDKSRETYAIPEGYDPVAAIAVGYMGDLEALDESQRERELAPRMRRSLDEIVYTGSWGETAELVK